MVVVWTPFYALIQGGGSAVRHTAGRKPLFPASRVQKSIGSRSSIVVSSRRRRSRASHPVSSSSPNRGNSLRAPPHGSVLFRLLFRPLKIRVTTLLEISYRVKPGYYRIENQRVLFRYKEDSDVNKYY